MYIFDRINEDVFSNNICILSKKKGGAKKFFAGFFVVSDWEFLGSYGGCWPKDC